MTVESVNSVFGLGLSVPKIALPIGISFFTFQALSYVIDVYRRKCNTQYNILKLALYISFFPQLIAGPIVMVLIFVIGHAINIFMNVLGAMVHPMRLTFVEFFKNSGYEGGGKEYKPFRNLE